MDLQNEALGRNEQNAGERGVYAASPCECEGINVRNESDAHSLAGIEAT